MVRGKRHEDHLRLAHCPISRALASSSWWRLPCLPTHHECLDDWPSPARRLTRAYKYKGRRVTHDKAKEGPLDRAWQDAVPPAPRAPVTAVPATVLPTMAYTHGRESSLSYTTHGTGYVRWEIEILESLGFKPALHARSAERGRRLWLLTCASHAAFAFSSHPTHIARRQHP